jgi:hypothetical protein
MAQGKKAEKCSGGGSQIPASDAMSAEDRSDESLSMNVDSSSEVFGKKPRRRARASGLKNSPPSENRANQPKEPIAGADGGPGKVPRVLA